MSVNQENINNINVYAPYQQGLKINEARTDWIETKKKETYLQLQLKTAILLSQ